MVKASRWNLGGINMRLKKITLEDMYAKIFVVAGFISLICLVIKIIKKIFKRKSVKF